MRQARGMLIAEARHCIFSFCVFAILRSSLSWAQETPACLDGFCIGQSIRDARFDKTQWIEPKEGFSKAKCTGVGCLPENAFRGYTPEDQAKLAEALSWKYGLNAYNVITKQNLEILRRYRYECDLTPRGIWGERRFIGAYQSTPSRYLTVVGLRLIHGELTVYRLARQYPYQNQNELASLARELGGEYRKRLLLYGYLSSNAYSDVIEQHKDGWFARSTLFNPTDLSDNAAELVLIDPKTRTLLQPSSMPESGEIKPLPVNLPLACNRSLPLQ